MTPTRVIVFGLDGRQETQVTHVYPGLWYGRFRNGRWRYYDRIGGAWGWLLYRERAPEPGGAT